MILYRGQGVVPLVGEWWTSDQAEAQTIAMSRHGRSWLVLHLEIDDEVAKGFVVFERVSGSSADWYRIPRAQMAEMVLGVEVASGRIEVRE